MIYCGKCHCCLEGHTNICVNRTTIGYEIDGGFAQYVKIPKEAIACGNVVEIPDNGTLGTPTSIVLLLRHQSAGGVPPAQLRKGGLQQDGLRHIQAGGLADRL